MVMLHDNMITTYVKRYRTFAKNDSQQYRIFTIDSNTCAYSRLIIKFADLLSPVTLYDGFLIIHINANLYIDERRY